MRIVAMVEFFPPSLGSDLRIHELLGRLSDRHAISFVVIPAFRELVGRIPRPREDGPPQADVLRVRFGPMEWRVWRASPVLAVLLTMPLLLLRTLRLAGRLKPDVIVANTPSAYTGLLSFLVARIRGGAGRWTPTKIRKSPRFRKAARWFGFTNDEPAAATLPPG